MKHGHLRANHIVLLVAALGAALFVFGSVSRGADTGFPIYFADSKLIVKPQTVNRTTYLPLIEIVQFLNLPYTDSIALETLTIRAPQARIVVTGNSGLISINDEIVLLTNPILREKDQWLAPIDFLNQGLSRAIGKQFRYRPGTSRVFTADTDAPELVMNAQVLGPITRLTIRMGAATNLNVQHDRQSKRAVLSLGRTPLDPLRERLDHRDRLVRSITFDDGDGNAKILLDVTDEVADIKVTPAEDNRVFFVDLMRKAESVAETAPPAPAITPDAGPDPGQPERKLRVVVIDPGHGGMDAGTRNTIVNEKELTLAIARKLRAALQSRLGATVLLTRDSDVAMDNEARSTIANNNQANLFISLHAGHSANVLDSGSSVFVMKEDFGAGFEPAGGPQERLFLPWYLGHRRNRYASRRAAAIFHEALSKAIPGWRFPVREAPLALLSSATMPSLLLELGNLNNSVNTQTMMDSGFQNRLITTIVDAVQRFSEP